MARAIFADRLPPDIIADRRRGMNHPTWFAELDRHRERIGQELEQLETSPTATRLLDLPRLKRLMDEWPKNAHAAQYRQGDYNTALSRAVHVGSFIRWVEGANR